MRKALDDLRHALGEGLTTTANVLSLPSGVTRERATNCAQSLSVTVLLRHMGLMVGKALADEMEADGLRPSAYAQMEGLDKILIKRLVDALGSEPDEFVRALREALDLRG